MLEATAKPCLRDRVICLVNRLAITAIRKVSTNKDWHFKRWSDGIELRWKTLYGQTYFGARILCDLTDFIGRRIFFFGVWEPNISAVFHAEVQPGDVIADVGANIGYDTLLASKIVGPGGKVIAIEASPSIFERLTNNLAINRVRNVRAVAVAVSDRPGELTLYAEEGNMGRTSSLQRAGATKAHTVPARPLDAILTPDELARLRFIKVDIEGGETVLLERLIETLDLYPDDLSILVEISEDESGRTKRAFEALLHQGFRAYAIENDYAMSTYLAVPPIRTPKEITAFPTGQMDVLFKRRAQASGQA